VLEVPWITIEDEPIAEIFQIVFFLSLRAKRSNLVLEVPWITIEDEPIAGVSGKHRLFWETTEVCSILSFTSHWESSSMHLPQQ
jgi:hypothetical protein